MVYQDNNDYMRDSYFYGNGMNNSYPYNGMMYGNMHNNPYMYNNFQNPMDRGQNSMNSSMNLENMYPQIYRIISPVVNRVISNANSQYMTEDNLNNMVDTVYNIVEGDISSLTSISTQNQGDDTVQVNTNPISNNTRGQTSGANNSANNSSNDRRGNNNSNNNSSINRLLRDLIKIIIIKELLSRQNNSNNFRQAQMQMNYYDPRNYFSTL